MMDAAEKAGMVSSIVWPVLAGQLVLFLLLVGQTIANVILTKRLQAEWLKKVEGILLATEEHYTRNLESRMRLRQQIEEVKAKQDELKEEIKREVPAATADKVVEQLHQTHD